MGVLIDFWYFFSGALGLILAFSGVLCGFNILILLVNHLIEKSFNAFYYDIKLLIFYILVVITSIVVNIEIPQNYKIVTEEVNNIVSYQGITNIQEGKYSNDYLYFLQGTNNSYSILKLPPDACKIHFINKGKIKVTKTHKEYLSFYKNLTLNVIFDDSIINYDIYIPK